MIIDCIGNGSLTGTSKIIWLLVVIFLPLVGSLLYFFLGARWQPPPAGLSQQPSLTDYPMFLLTCLADAAPWTSSAVSGWSCLVADPAGFDLLDLDVGGQHHQSRTRRDGAADLGASDLLHAHPRSGAVPAVGEGEAGERRAAAFVVIWVLGVGFWLWMISDCLGNEALKGVQRLAWLLAVVCLPGLGSAAVLSAGQGRARQPTAGVAWAADSRARGGRASHKVHQVHRGREATQFFLRPEQKGLRRTKEVCQVPIRRTRVRLLTPVPGLVVRGVFPTAHAVG